MPWLGNTSPMFVTSGAKKWVLMGGSFQHQQRFFGGMKIFSEQLVNFSQVSMFTTLLKHQYEPIKPKIYKHSPTLLLGFHIFCPVSYLTYHHVSQTTQPNRIFIFLQKFYFSSIFPISANTDSILLSCFPTSSSNCSASLLSNTPKMCACKYYGGPPFLAWTATTIP